jgi:thiol-disulfide isomerase/thioredoxin
MTDSTYNSSKKSASGKPPMSITEDPTTVPPQSSAGSMLLMAIVTVAAAAAILSAYLRPPMSGIPYGFEGPSRIGTTMPKLKVEGWINGPGPTSEELKGQIWLVDVWAFWCGPCRAISPELVKLQAKYGPQGVQFVGLTSEDQQALSESEKFVEDEKLTWPQGYGADPTLDPLYVDTIPQVWVIGRDGRIAWDQTSREPVESALDRLLKPELEPAAVKTTSTAE